MNELNSYPLQFQLIFTRHRKASYNCEIYELPNICLKSSVFMKFKHSIRGQITAESTLLAVKSFSFIHIT
jgi:hypothetical protein